MDKKTILIFAGNKEQYDRFIKENDYLRDHNCIYVHTDEQIIGINFALTIPVGESWLNTVYRSERYAFHVRNGIFQEVDLPTLKEELGLPRDFQSVLGINVSDGIGTKDGLKGQN